MIKIIINGSTGKMGKLAITPIQKSGKFTIVATPTRHENLTDVIKQHPADVVLDLTEATVAYQHTKTIIEAGCTPVIGTSGLTAVQITELQKLAKQHQVGGIIVPNFSIGAVLMMQFSEIACHYFDDIHIIETHHVDKKDKPSGTARRTAEVMAAIKNIAYEKITIESHRKNDAVAKQTTLFKTTHESLAITHNSFDRECFMPGVLLACERAPSLTELVVGLDNILRL